MHYFSWPTKRGHASSAFVLGKKKNKIDDKNIYRQQYFQIKPRQVFIIHSTIYSPSSIFSTPIPSSAPPQCLRPAAHVQHNDPFKGIKNINTCL